MKLQYTSTSSSVQLVAPATTSAAQTSAAVEIRHFASATVEINFGAMAADCTAKLQEADEAAGPWTDVPDSEVVIASADHVNSLVRAIEVDSSARKPFVRLVATPGGATELAASLIRHLVTDTRYGLTDEDAPKALILRSKGA